MKYILNFTRDKFVLMVRFFMWLLCWFLFFVSLHSSVSDLPVGAKYIALGGLASSIGEDVYSTYYNPALLDFANRQQISAEYTGMFLGMDDKIAHTFLSYAIPTKKLGCFGFYYKNFFSNTYYNENVFALSYGKNKIFKIKRVDFGVRFKGINVSYNPEEGVYTNEGIFVPNKVDSIFSNGKSKFVLSIDFVMDLFIW